MRFFASLALLAVPGFAQSIGGSIFGTVRDAQGGVARDAQITIRNVETGITRALLTGQDGVYRAPNLQPGLYEIAFAAPGFAPGLRKDITLTVGAELLVDFELRVSGVSEKVEVTAQETAVDTATSTITHTVAGSTIRELPLNGRDWTQLAALQPGVASVGTAGGTRSGNGVKLTVSGGRPGENNFRMDGISMNDYANNTPGNVLGTNLGVEAIREFSVISNSFSAEYGRSSGGVINAVTRSGGNDIHGTLYYFHRNSALDARNFFDRGSQPAFRRHQFGGAAGGPVVKNKTFWFADYESVREFLGQTVVSTTPSARARTGQVASGTVAVDPAIAKVFGLYPLPNGPLVGNGDTGQLFSVNDRVSSGHYVIGKLDHRFSEASSVTGSYFHDNATIRQPDAFRNALQKNLSGRHGAMLEFTRIPSPTMVSVSRAGFSRTISDSGAFDEVLNPLLTDTSLGFVPGKPAGSIVVPGVTNLAAGPGSFDFALLRFTSFQAYQNLFVTKGIHALKLGLSVERMRFNFDLPNLLGGQFSFGSMADFLGNRPAVFAALYPGSDTYRGARQTIVAGYAQDDMRLTPRLTVNLGLRYEFASIPSEVNNKVALLKRLTDPTVTVGGPILDRNPARRNFSPRVGLAWDPFGDSKTSVRAGFGVFDVLPLLNLYDTPLTRSTPLFRQGIATNPPLGSFPAQAFGRLGVQNLRTAFVEREPGRAYSLKFNLTLQRQVRTWLFEAGYVGSRGVRLPLVERNMNTVVPVRTERGWVYPPVASSTVLNPNFASINTTNTWNADANYHGLQVSTRRAVAKGLQVTGSYTWSKSIDTASSASSVAATSGYSTAVAVATPLIPGLNRGLSDFDIRHNAIFGIVWDAPVPAALAGEAKGVLAGWQIGAIHRLQNGLPMTPVLNNDRAGSKADTVGTSLGQRPDFVNSAGCGTAVNSRNPSRYIKTECFSFPAVGVLGNLDRNTINAPGLWNLDFSLMKTFRWADKMNTQFRAESFNALNHTNFGSPVPIIFDIRGATPANAGLITTTSTAARQIQLGLKLSW